MSTTKFLSIPTKRLSQSITSASSSFKVNNIEGWDGVDLSSGDFGEIHYVVFRNPTNTIIEIMEIDPTTVADSSITINKRGLDFNGDLTTETSALKLDWPADDTLIEFGTNAPQVYQWLKEYIDGIAIAGSPDSTTSVKGVGKVSVAPASASNPIFVGDNDPRVPTADENNAMAGGGSLGTPSSSNKYQTETGVTTALASLLPPGVMTEYGGRTAPTGWLMCDGSAVSRSTYANLFAVICPSQSYSASSASPTVITATGHGLVAGDKIHFTTATGGRGITAGTTYYVSATNLEADSFKMSLVPGGTLVNTTGVETGTLYKSAWGAGDGTTTFNVPDRRSVIGIGRSAAATSISLTFDDGLVSTGDDTITVPDKFFPAQGQAVALTTSGTLPTGLSATTYYVIRDSATTIKLATSQANANAGTAVDITAASGGGIHTLTYTLTTHPVLGKRKGEEEHGISDAEMASHVHSLGTNDGNGTGYFASASTGNTPMNTGSTGSDTQHNNMPPTITVNYIIKT